jgi:hypothetical protein
MPLMTGDRETETTGCRPVESGERSSRIAARLFIPLNSEAKFVAFRAKVPPILLNLKEI